jgi:hypothetical protein
MAGKTAYLEKLILNTLLRRLTTAVSGSNASTTNLLVTSSTGFAVGHMVKVTATGSFHEVTAVPDSTHVTVSPALGSAPTTGNLEAHAYRPATVYVGLFTAAPSDSGGGTEVSTGNYARQQVTQADGSWAAPSGTPSATSNSSAITWSGVTWSGTVTHFGIFDAATSGNLLAWFDSTDKTINSGDTVQFAAAALGWSED